MNDSGPVSPQTRSRIQTVAETLGYVPNDAARSLITNKTSTLGVLLPDLYGEFYSEVMRGIDQAARRNRYHMLVSNSHNDRNEIAKALRAMQGRVDGLIIMSPDIDAQALKANLPASQPVVLLNCFVDGCAFDSLNVDNYGGAYAMVRHLIGLGHRLIALFKGDAGNYDAQERLRGYRSALRDGGLAWSASLEYEGDFREGSGYEAARKLAGQAPRPTAVFASNDAMAVGAISAFRQEGLQVPADIAVVGFDDIPIARYMSPPLTSVHVPISELGARAVERLFVALREKNQQVRKQELLPTSLVVRGSCGAVKGASADTTHFR